VFRGEKESGLLELTFFLQQMINGVALGPLRLIAIGYTMVYGSSGSSTSPTATS